MPTLEEIRRLSPAALAIYKQQAYRQARAGDPYMSRLVQTPEYQSIMGAPERPWWQHPLDWMRGVEKGAGTILMAPFTPRVAGTENLPWFEREKAEYEAWEEPSFEVEPWFRLPWTPEEVRAQPWKIGVKGVVEQVPWFATAIASGGLGLLGWTGRTAGIKGLQTAATLGRQGLKPVMAVERAVATAPFKAVGKVIKPILREPIVEDVMRKTGRWFLPSEELLNKAYKQDSLRRFAQWAEDKPIVGSIIRSLGGEAAFVRAESQLPEHIVQRAVINNARLLETGVNLSGAIMPRLRKIGDPTKVLDIAEDGIVRSAMPKGNWSRYLNDILENPDRYNFSTPQAKQYISEFTAIRKDLAELLKAEGLKQSPKVHRIVKGIVTEDGKLIESKFGSDPSLTRLYETQEEAALAHLKKGQKIIYGVNPDEIAQFEIDRTIHRIARKRFAETISPLGKKPIERFAEVYPEKAKELLNLSERQAAAKNALDIVQRVLSYKATTIPGATLAKIGRELPDMAGRIRILFELTPKNTDKIMAAMGRELRSALKTDPQMLKNYTKTISDINVTFRGQAKITMMDIEDAIKVINKDADLEARLIIKGYQETVKANRQFFKDFMIANKDYLDNVINETKTAISPLKKERHNFLQGYAGRERLPHKAGEVTERPFNRIPEFRGKFFDDKIVTYLEKTYADEGTKWLQTMGSVSAMSRNLTAVLDDSAPFIQGLFVFGRRPDLWARATLRQLEYLFKPENLAKRMALPEKQALHAEMVKYGSTIASFELFEALPQLERVVGKIPKVGEAATKAVKQTYGRAEAAFTGFGQESRDLLWESLRRPGMADVELQELAHSLDLMTGNISLKAMGIAATQRDLEKAFGFFSPRFTRASLAYIGNVFRGGISGAEARKGVGGLMAAGAVMYLGAAKATGQEPNFDPSSARFMTIKVGDDYVGVGGMLYSLARLAGNLASVDDPADLLKLDRFDNPFIKFLYGKSAPLTGALVGIIEQKDYMGQPFESTADWGRFLAEKTLPFSVQPFFEKETPGAASFGAQAVGLRTFPESTYEKRQDAREEIGTDKYGKAWASLTKLEQREVDKAPEIQKLKEQMEREGRETPESQTWDRWNQETELIENAYRKAITLASREYEATGNGALFREKVNDAADNRRYAYSQRALNPDYTMIMDYLNTPKSPEALAKMQPVDIARDEYYQLMYSPDMYDQYGTYNFDLADQKEDFFIQKYGQQAMNYIEEFAGSKWEEPMAMKVLREAKRTLEPYREIENQIWSQYPPELQQIAKQIDNLDRTDPRQADRMLFQYPQIVYIRKQIAFYKRRLKMMRPDIAQALRTFY